MNLVKKGLTGYQLKVLAMFLCWSITSTPI